MSERIDQGVARAGRFIVVAGYGLPEGPDYSSVLAAECDLDDLKRLSCFGADLGVCLEAVHGQAFGDALSEIDIASGDLCERHGMKDQ
ncbi:hypothetical protein [Phytoactinopolyspora endophytica]|uniref:hypothetical protein n=1 Tax=Phytoactinopolyspora endophytica TaxID=1642495 RepID=UPI00101DB1D1|nr:hypothetical protein [Phytoactinopolyspora endophytica]